MLSRRGCRAILVLNLLLVALVVSLAGSNGKRRERQTVTGATSAGPMHLQWVREYPKLKPAWPDQVKLQFDTAYRPVPHGRSVLVASSVTDSVTALDAETGQERWRFQADGPVRFAPVIWEERAYFVSDDGYLYCVDAGRGELHWKVRGGPSGRKVLGNGRLISMWPARGAPAVAEDGVVYFAAGIWPFMGIFLRAVDARTGQEVWTNDGDGSTYTTQPHHADSFAGIAPQGHLAVAGERLIVPGGRSVPAGYDRRTGRQLFFHLSDYSRVGGGFEVSANRTLFVNGGAAFDLATGDYLAAAGEPALLTDDVLYGIAAGELAAYDVRRPEPELRESIDRRGRRFAWSTWQVPKLGSAALPFGREAAASSTSFASAARSTADPSAALARDANRLYAGSGHLVCAIDLPLTGNKALAWQMKVEGTVAHLAAADGRLFVSTREGRIWCYGPEPVEAVRHESKPVAPVASPELVEQTRALLETVDVREGWCIVWGAPLPSPARGEGIHERILELARQSDLHVIVVEPDAERVRSLRAALAQAGLHGERVAVVQGSWETVQLPPYLASLMLMEHAELPAMFFKKAFSSLRPYGGVAFIPVTPEGRPGLESAVADAKLERARMRRVEGAALLAREGALPGSADWTHEHADAANSRVSRDRLVQAPLGLLWFGGPPHDPILPRHGHGPQPQVVDGRIIIEGADLLRAVDVYTGRLLWESRLNGVGKEFDSTWHQAGANGSGTNYISTPDGIYVALGKSCLRLDPATGKRLAEFPLPRLPGAAEHTWGYINVSGDFLVGGANPPGRQTRAWDTTITSSKHLVVMNRHTGKVLWTAAATGGFRHNAVCIGKGRLYAVDRPASDRYYDSRRGNEPAESEARLSAFDLRSGKAVWTTKDKVFGTWLSYSDKHDILVEAGRGGRDTLWDEADGMRAYAAGTGKVLWHKTEYSGPAMIHGDAILKDRSACDLRTGKPVFRTDPITGAPAEWKWSRDYGCNTPAGSEHLLTFRSGAAGFFDLKHDGGTGNLGGFRSGCTNNLIVAGGVLSAPDYTRTCTCSYQNQTSLALVHMPEAELWTYLGPQEVGPAVRRLGINLGAPGNRKAPDGTLWLEYPVAGGPSPRAPVTLTGTARWFRRHSSWVEKGELPWVAASGLQGAATITLRLIAPSDISLPFGFQPAVPKTYTVRLHFIEPEDMDPGRRVFDVTLQGRTVLKDFDVCREAGGPRRGLVKEFKGVAVSRELAVGLEAGRGAPPVLCGIEVVAE